MKQTWTLLGLLAWLVVSPHLVPADEPAFTRKEDVIYGRKFGTALTMDVFTPKANANGLGLIWVVSGGWFSGHEGIGPGFVTPFVERGYTVFAVVHGSQPKFTIPEILQDMNRAVRFIRYHAKDYGIDPDHIGIYGGSAGGHLSLMQGVAGDKGSLLTADPVDRASSRVQAVACFFPPTDFLNYGKEGENAVGRGILENFHAPFAFHELDPKTKTFVLITDEAKITEIAKQISPVTHVTADDPPTLIFHGDADTLVPMQQSELIVKKLKDAGVEAKLVVKPGASHGWAGLDKDLSQFADWFDAHLKKSAAETKAKAAAAGNESQPAEKRPSQVWTLVGPLGETPKRVNDDFPLSDQENHGGWTKFAPMSDEFEGESLDRDKWNVGMRWWAGRQPALFSEKNVTVSAGRLHLTMRKEALAAEFEKRGYHDYTSAALHTKARSSFGYYEVKARPMNSGGSSSFWFTKEDAPDWATEIDVFEIGGKAKGFENKDNMTLHVWKTPRKKEHWSVGSAWKAPWRLADDFHVYGLDWSESELAYYVDGVVVHKVENTHWHQPLYLIFDSETMPEWFGMPDDADLPSTFDVEYVRTWKHK